MTSFVRYRDDLEKVDADEAETIEAILDVMRKRLREAAAGGGEAVRISHAKAHGFVSGTLTVLPNLPPELAQGLFAHPGEHDVLVRLSQAPGESLDDRAVSSPRGMAVKVFGVEGANLEGHRDATTQDFVLETGKVFVNRDAKAFLAGFPQTAKLAPRLPEGVKSVAEATNGACHAVGADSPKLDIDGHPPFHPLAEAYYSQIALRYGDYVAKLAIVPANPALRELSEEHVALDDENALRTAVNAFFAEHGASYDVKVQLATDEARMPVEDPTVEWPEDESPYRTVARLTLPPHGNYGTALSRALDRSLSFEPGHALAAHRPLGSIGRSRLAVYPVLSARRRIATGNSRVEPRSLAEAESALLREAEEPKPTRALARRRPGAGLGFYSAIVRNPMAALFAVSAALLAVSWLFARREV